MLHDSYVQLFGNNTRIYFRTTMFSIKGTILKRLSLLKFIYVGLLFCSNFLFAQQFQLKIDSDYLKNYQIEIDKQGKSSLFLSNNGFVNIFNDDFLGAKNIIIVDLDKQFTYRLYNDELKIKDSVLYFTSGKLIEEVVISSNKNSIELGIPHKGATTKLYTMPDIISVIEIPKTILDEG